MVQESHGSMTESFVWKYEARIRGPHTKDCHVLTKYLSGGTTRQFRDALTPDLNKEELADVYLFAFLQDQLRQSTLKWELRPSSDSAIRSVVTSVDLRFYKSKSDSERLIDQSPGMVSVENHATDANESWNGRGRLFRANPPYIVTAYVERACPWASTLASMLIQLLLLFLDIVVQSMLKVLLPCLRGHWIHTTALLGPCCSTIWSEFSFLQGMASRRRAPVLRPATLEVNGELNGTSIVAIADTGSCFNLISEELAQTMGLQPSPGTQGRMLLPNNRQVMSPGEVGLTFQFPGEIASHRILCAILPKSTRELVLGGAFLKATQTMTLHRHRLRKVASCHTKPSLNLIGAGQDFLGGYLNGHECIAVPDTGSDITAISMEYARSLRLKIYGSQRSLVQFLDGSQAMTEGIVRAKWQFGRQEKPIYHEFHVLEGLPASVILSCGILDEFDVFCRYAHLIGSAGSTSSNSWLDPSGLSIFGISLVKRCEEEIKASSDSFLDDTYRHVRLVTSDNPFTPEKIERERARRDEIRDSIARIPDQRLRAAKQDEECLRKWRWDSLRKRHLEENPNPASTPDANGRDNQRGLDGVYTGPMFLPTRTSGLPAGLFQLDRLTVDDSTSSQATQQPRRGLQALRRLFR